MTDYNNALWLKVDEKSMPELPEVETIRLGLEQSIVGHIIHDIAVYRRDLRVPLPALFEQEMKARQVQGVSRQGKYLLIDFTDEAPSLLIHLGMSGKVRLTPKEEKTLLPHTHVVLTFNNGSCLAFVDPRRFGFMHFLGKNLRLAHLGTEPLEEEFTPTYLANKIKSKRSPIKSVLLDQAIVAGLGNIYVLEALFRAGISPFRPALDLDISAAQRLVQSIKVVLLDAIQAGGSTLKDYKGIYGDGGYFQHQFLVYGRAGEPCTRCLTCPILCHKQGGRSTYYCGHCQV